jgi:DNA-binding CsgD family transcriptional regulator
VLQRALAAFQSDALPPEDGLRWLWLAGRLALILFDHAACEALAVRHVRLAREAGALTVLPTALTSRLSVHLFAGELDAAIALIQEAQAVTEATGSRLAPYGALVMSGWRGREADAAALVAANREELERRGEGAGLTVIQISTAMLYNGLGRYDEALSAARQIAEHGGVWSTWGLVELMEAAVRAGDVQRAIDGFAGLSAVTQASGTDWALGMEARSRALLHEDGHAEPHYREAIERIERAGVRGYVARTQLNFGEWLRRRRRRLDAREQLRRAHERLSAMGMEAYAARAARELQATGGTARRRTADATDQLTAQEAQIARLAGEGLSNPEIAAQLFISPRTVEYHLHKVFAKLEIRSRAELQQVSRHAGWAFASGAPSA